MPRLTAPRRQAEVCAPLPAAHAAARYARHLPERTLLYALVQAHYPDFIARLEAEDRPLPEYVREEFETYLRCGVVEHGFLRVVCEHCRAERLVAYSCKKRGFCPSCGARRMAESGRHWWTRCSARGRCGNPLTLSPALCALILKPGHESHRGLFGLFNRAFDRIQGRYTNGVGLMLKHGLLSMVLFGLLLVIAAGLFRSIPMAFLPDEDQGHFITVVQLPDGASKKRTDAVLDQVEQYYHTLPAIYGTQVLSGQNFVFNTRGTNTATMFTPLKPWDERKREQDHAKSIIGGAFSEFAKIPGALVLAFNAPSIRGLGATGGFSMQLQDSTGGDFKKFGAVAQEFVARARQDPAIGSVSTSFRVSAPRVQAKINREGAKALGVPISEVFDTLQAYFGNLYVNDFVKFGRVYRVQTEAEPQYRARPSDISKIYVRATNGQGVSMIPLDTVVTTTYSSGPDPVTHFNGFNTALVLGSAAPGYSSGQALDALERAAQDVLLPQGFDIDWSGISYQERKAGTQSMVAFGFGLLMVFLLLAAQYESWSVPFAVILAVPFGVFGALVAVWLSGMANDIYFQIGLVTLIGLAAKNAILIVEFANQRYAHGLSLKDAAIEAAQLRFRPILMTSMAFILDVVPLMLASGAGAASRHSIGIGVFGGMLAATFLAVFFVPLFFVLVRSFVRPAARPVPADGAEAIRAGSTLTSREGGQ